MKKRLIGAAAALLLAIFGTVAVTSYVQGADQRALRGTETKTVIVVEKEIPANTQAADLPKFTKASSLPASAIAPGAVSDLASVAGKVTSGTMAVGEQLLGSRMVDPASLTGPGKAAVPAGMQEVTVQLSPDRLVGGQISAGDTVGVFVSFTSGAGNAGPTTHLAFQKVLVTGIQGAPSESATKPSTAPGPPVPAGSMLATLARPAADAEKIVFAAEFGTIWLSKEPAGATTDGTSVITKDGYFR